MKKELMEILACPIDKHHPLELVVFEAKEEEIQSGIIKCPQCGRWYPIINSVPHLLPDSKRSEEKDKQFLRDVTSKISSEILLNGKPFNIADEVRGAVKLDR